MTSRVALVTGCSSGIGLALAEALVASGWCVYAGARDADSLDRLASLGALAVRLDVCEAGDREAAVDRILSEQGALTALVNNAGFGLHGAVEATDLDAVRRQLETNFVGAVGLVQAVLPSMRAKGSGTILNMSSMGGRLSFPGGAFYHASKHALEAFSDVLRFEVAGFGLRVVVVEPGPVASRFGATGIDGVAEGAPDVYAGLNESIRAGLTSTFEGPGSERSSTPEEVARVCVEALESDAPRSRYVVGAMAEGLIRQRVEMDDEAWDGFLEGLYARPGPVARDDEID
ncbi:MAG: SDR family NAD(P)-dependent oxidoreductase [bacterium]|nr:SDR family NAD(P)-dependent oxidoreductase [bacterium]